MLNEGRSRTSRARQALAAARSRSASISRASSRVTNYESQVTAYEPARPSGGSQITSRSPVKARAPQAREKQPHQNSGSSRGRLHSTQSWGDAKRIFSPFGQERMRTPRRSPGVSRSLCPVASLPPRPRADRHKVSGCVRRISLKINGRPHRSSTHFSRSVSHPSAANRHNFEGATP
jgi:hypothetical protein